MRSNLFWLDDDRWRRIEPHLPTDVRGKERADDRRVISGILHVLRSGCRWKDCPPEYGPHTTIYNRLCSLSGLVTLLTDEREKPVFRPILKRLRPQRAKCPLLRRGSLGASTLRSDDVGR